ncbi:Hypothetical protein, putative [Bodo saltans]|uniref:Treble clef zinc finger domain-containing protein n=1 Tax=Bodo saltans TaxID=75058 RepID=A0A0S4JTC6_BODSA|nr:Hypothetical protein, putative [Bodo saltans]|eukprot:CUG93463.1 Hypothetical protein, putative [Bodo saltans]
MDRFYIPIADALLLSVSSLQEYSMKKTSLIALGAPSLYSLGLVRRSPSIHSTLVLRAAPSALAVGSITQSVLWASSKGKARRTAAVAETPLSKGTAVFPKTAKKKQNAAGKEGEGIEEEDSAVDDIDAIVENSISEADRAANTSSASSGALDGDDPEGSIDEQEASENTAAIFTTGREAASGDANADKSDENIEGEGDEFNSLSEEETAQSKHMVVLLPNLAKQYAATNPIPLANILVDNGAVVRWCCNECSHEWKQAVFLRCILKNPCPSCDAVKNPTLKSNIAASTILKEWDSDRNDPFVDPETLPISSPHKAWWTCTTCRTSFEARVKSRVQGKSLCPTCSVTTLQSSSASNETIQLEWHPVKNGDLRLEQVPPTTKVWWLCSACGHEWDASVGQRLRLKRTSNCSQCNKKAAAAR